MKWIKNTFNIATHYGLSPRQGYTSGGVIGLHREGSRWTLTDLHTGRAHQTFGLKAEAVAFAQALMPYYDADPQWGAGDDAIRILIEVRQSL